MSTLWGTHHPDHDPFVPWLHMSFTALDDEIDEGYAVLRELLLETKLTDTDMIKNLVATAKNSLKRSINTANYTAMIHRMLSNTSDSMALYDYLRYLPYYEFLCSVEAALEDKPESVIAALERVKAYIAEAGAGAITGYAGSEAGFAKHTEAAEAFVASLGNTPHGICEYSFEPTPASEALIVESNTSFNLITASWEDMNRGGQYSAALDAVCSFIDDQYLIPVLRDERGAYGASIGASQDYIYLFTYRDPGVSESFEFCSRLGSLLAAETDVTQAVVDGYIMSAYSTYASPEGELTGAYSALINRIAGYADDLKVTRMQQLKSLTAEDIASYGSLLEDFISCGRIATVSSASTINACSGLYENILNPFGAVDKSAVAVSDVTEDYEYYAAVRYCFENGFMSLNADGAFAPEAPLLHGDMAVALYKAAMGGSVTAEEAIAFLAGYQVIDDCAPDYEVTRYDHVCNMCSFVYALGGSIDETEALNLADADALEEGMQPYFDWCIANGILAPTADGLYAPEATITRGEFAQALYAMFS